MITLAIATRNDYKGLWFTIHSALSNVMDTPLEGAIRFTVVNNSDNPISKKLVRSVCSRVDAFIAYKEVDVYSNHAGRNEAVRMSKTPITVLCDSHIIFGNNYFSEISSILNNNKRVGLLHVPMSNYFIPVKEKMTCFYNLVKFHINMHGSYSRGGALWDRPYPVAISPHGCYAFRTQQWLDYGGYIEDCVGHGGGEPYVTYKYWMFGSEVWLTPRTHYFHYKLSSYKKIRSQWRMNCARTAFALGGQEIGNKYAKRMKCDKIAQELWKKTKKHHEFVKSKSIIDFSNIAEYMASKQARPLSPKMPEPLS